MDWIKHIIDSFYFKRDIRRGKLGLGEEDIEWLKDHSARIIRINEIMKEYIYRTTLHSLTLRDHQRKKDWYDCLTTMQQLCKNTNAKQKIDWLTMKPKSEKKDN